MHRISVKKECNTSHEGKIVLPCTGPPLRMHILQVMKAIIIIISSIYIAPQHKYEQSALQKS